MISPESSDKKSLFRGAKLVLENLSGWSRESEVRQLKQIPKARGRGNLLILGSSPGYAFSIGTLILNLARKSPGVFSDLVVYATDLTQRDKEIISHIIPAEFKRYRTAISRGAIRRSPYIRYFTPDVFAKLEAFRLVNNFRSVTWLDTDIVVERSLGVLTEHGKAEGKFIVHGTIGGNLLRPIAGTKVTAPGIASGTFSLGRNMLRHGDLYSEMLEIVERESKNLFLPEQAIISIILDKYSIKWEELDSSAWVSRPEVAPADAYIVHATGPSKFWNGTTHPDWDDNYQEWLALGGSPISRFARHRDFLRLPLKLEIRLREIFRNLKHRKT